MMKMMSVLVASSIAGMKIMAISLVRYLDCAINSTSCSSGLSSGNDSSSIIKRQSKSKSH